MLCDWELWACANRLVEQHGREAISKAMSRVFELGEAGDKDGNLAWSMILERVVRLLREVPAPDETVQ